MTKYVKSMVSKTRLKLSGSGGRRGGFDQFLPRLGEKPGFLLGFLAEKSTIFPRNPVSLGQERG